MQLQINQLFGNLLAEIKQNNSLQNEFLKIVEEDFSCFAPHFYIAARVCYSSKSIEQLINELQQSANRIPHFLLNLLERGHTSIFGLQYRVVTEQRYPNYYRLLKNSLASWLNKIVVLEPTTGYLFVNSRLNMELLRLYLMHFIDAKVRTELTELFAQAINNRPYSYIEIDYQPITYELIHLEETNKQILTAEERAYFSFLRELDNLDGVPTFDFGAIYQPKFGIPDELKEVPATEDNPLLKDIPPAYYNRWFIIQTVRNAATQILRHTMLNFTQRSNRYTAVFLSDYRFSYETIKRGLHIWQRIDNLSEKERKVLEWLQLFVNRAKGDIAFYNWLLNNGYKKEDARDEVFQRQFTTLNAAGLTMYWQKFLELRLDKKAQWYTRIVARIIADLL